MIQSHRLVLLHGPSGVGKSSLLQAGLIADLRAEGATVFANDQWGGMPHDDVRSFLAAKFGLADTPGAAQESDPFGDLAASLGNRAILVLDQFEELVRYSPRAASLVFDLIVDLNRRYETKIVISFRSEYLHDFAELQRRVVNFTHSQFSLPELPDEAARGVVLAGNKSVQGAVSEEAADTLSSAWVAARRAAASESAGDDPFSRIGLLHLQALLYALYFTLEGAPLTESSLAEGIEAWCDLGLPQADLGRSTFRFALERAIDFKLEHCEHAGSDEDGSPRLDPFLTAGTRWMLERTVPHLSSAGYKLIRDARELATLALGTDLDSVRDGLRVQGPVHDDQDRGLFEVIVDSASLGHGHRSSIAGPALAGDVLTATRQDLAAAADRWLEANACRATWGQRLAVGGAPPVHANDPLGVTCGPMFGLTPADVWVEELRRYAFCLVWLEASALVRITTPAGSSAMVSLIHDGFGAALRTWAQRWRNSPEGPLAAITAPRGVSYTWSDGPTRRGVERPAAVSAPVGDHRLVPNLRWRGGFVQADFERVAFLNCDFRGTLFQGCRLTAITFVNCLLDGAIFSDCIFAGTLPLATSDEGWSEDEPDFVISAAPELAAIHRRYRSTREEGPAAFLCDLPGAPAIPHDGREATTRVVFSDRSRPVEVRRLQAPLCNGGVAVFGGRMSSLVLRSCIFEQDSGFSVRHSTGSGLDVVEVLDSPGHLELFGCAVRHVGISSTPIDEVPPRVFVYIGASTVAQVYTGVGLRGTVLVERSLLVHAWNGSPGDGDTGLHFVARDCSINGTIDVDVDDCKPVGVGPQTETLRDLGVGGVADRMTRMDYRRNPAALRDLRSEQPVR